MVSHKILSTITGLIELYLICHGGSQFTNIEGSLRSQFYFQDQVIQTTGQYFNISEQLQEEYDQTFILYGANNESYAGINNIRNETVRMYAEAELGEYYRGHHIK